MKEIDSTAGAASYVDRPAKTLVNWRSLGIGPAYIRAGRAVRYRKVDVDAWLDKNTIRPREDTAARPRGAA